EKLPKKGKKKRIALRRDQLLAILRVSKPAWRLAFALAAFAGLRAGEVMALRWKDVDLVAQVIVVRYSRSKKTSATPKSGHERKVPLAAALLSLREAGENKGRDEHVAKTTHGGPWEDSGLLQAFRRAQKKVGLIGFRYHDLRHYFITHALKG